MKLSNFMLSLVAAATVSCAVGVSSLAATRNPSSVIYVKSNDSTQASVSFKVPANLSSKQVAILDMAYTIAKEDGHSQPQLLQGIILQESGAGTAKSYRVAGQEFGLKANSRYYGVAQIKLAAAKDVLSAYPELKKKYSIHSDTDEEIIANLILNDKYNIAVASKYLLILEKTYKVAASNLAAAYNQGPGGQFNDNGAKYSDSVHRQAANLSRNKI